MLFHLLPAPQVGAVKGDDQFVVSLSQCGRHVDPFWSEHVVRLQDGGAIEHDGGEGIQAVKGQDCFAWARLVDSHVGQGEGGAVHPAFLANPLHLQLILANIGVGDEAMVHEVQVHVGRELGYGQKVDMLAVGLLELPILVNGYHLSWCHLVECGSESCHCAARTKGLLLPKTSPAIIYLSEYGSMENDEGIQLGKGGGGALMP